MFLFSMQKLKIVVEVCCIVPFGILTIVCNVTVFYVKAKNWPCSLLDYQPVKYCQV